MKTVGDRCGTCIHRTDPMICDECWPSLFEGEIDIDKSLRDILMCIVTATVIREVRRRLE